jgi:hypothetical protein
MSPTGTAAIHRMPGAGLLSRRRAWRTADSAEHLGWSHSTTWHTGNGMLRQTRAMTPSNLGDYMTADSHRCQTIIGFAPTAAVGCAVFFLAATIGMVGMLVLSSSLNMGGHRLRRPTAPPPTYETPEA